MGKKNVFISYCEKQLLLLRNINGSNPDKKVKSEMIIVHNNIEKEIDLYNQYLTMKKDIGYDAKNPKQQALLRKNAIKLLKAVRKFVKQCSSKAYDRYCANFDFPILASSLQKIYSINMSLEQYLNYEIKLCKKRNPLDLRDIKDYQNKILHMLEQRLKTDDTVTKKEVTEEELEKRIEDLDKKIQDAERQQALGNIRKKWKIAKSKLDKLIEIEEKKAESDDELISLGAQRDLQSLYEQRQTEEKYRYLLDDWHYVDAIEHIIEGGVFNSENADLAIKLCSDYYYIQSSEYEKKKSLATALKVISLLIVSPIAFVLAVIGGAMTFWLPILSSIVVTIVFIIPVFCLPRLIDKIVFGSKLPEKDRGNGKDFTTAAIISGATTYYASAKLNKFKKR